MHTPHEEASSELAPGLAFREAKSVVRDQRGTVTESDHP